METKNSRASNLTIIRKASLNDQENVVSLLEEFYPGVTDHWRKIFAPRPWTIADDIPGYVIVNQEEVVGFLGTIFSEHETENGKIRICNLTTWYVKPQFRQHGLKLFLEVMKIPNVSWTNLTAAPHTYDWLCRSGFKTLIDKQTLIFPLPQLFNRCKKIQLIIEPKKNQLSPKFYHIHQMHQGLCCKSVLISRGDDECYCILVTTRYKKIPLAKIYYISNPTFFKEVIMDIRFKLALKLRVCYLQIEGNLFSKHRVAGVFVKDLFPPRLYKSAVLDKNEIPLLGSELFVLGI